MSTWLKQSTAVDIGLGPFVDQTDGFTPETSLTIAQADVRLKKNGGAWAQKSDTNSATHEENGWYEVALNTTDTNTLGELIVAVNESGALPVWRVFQVVPANVYDSLVAGSDALQVHTNEITAGLIVAATFGAGAIDNAAIATDAIGSAELATSAVNEIRDSILSDSTPFPGARIDATISSRSTYAGGAVASVTAPVTVGTNNDKTGYSLSAAGVQAIWDALTAALTTAGSIGKLLADNINATISSRATPAQVNAEVLDVLTVDTFAEPSSVPAATSTIKDKLGWLFMLARNERRTTSSSDVVRNDANSATVATSTISDDGTTFTRGEYS